MFEGPEVLDARFRALTPSIIVRNGGEEDAIADARPNAVVDRLPFLRGSQRRPADRARTAFGDAQPSASVSPKLLAGHHIVLCELHSHEVRGDVQHDGRVD